MGLSTGAIIDTKEVSVRVPLSTLATATSAEIEAAIRKPKQQLWDEGFDRVTYRMHHDSLDGALVITAHGCKTDGGMK